MVRNDFLVAWLIVATLLLFLVVGGTFYLVYQSGLLTGEAPLVEESSSLGSSILDLGDDESGETEDGSKRAPRESMMARVFCVNPDRATLVAEQRAIRRASHDPGVIANVLRALNQNPETEGLVAAVPPEIQIQTVFLDPERKTVVVDLATLPDTWDDADPIEIGLCLYAITHTIYDLHPERFQFVRFLVGGAETNARPGGWILSEPFGPSPDWLGADSANRETP